MVFHKPLAIISSVGPEGWKQSKGVESEGGRKEKEKGKEKGKEKEKKKNTKRGKVIQAVKDGVLETGLVDNSEVLVSLLLPVSSDLSHSIGGRG